MAIIIIDIVQSEAEEIKEITRQMEMGEISEEKFKEELMKILGEALPRGPERDDEIRLRVVKRTQVGYTGGKKVVH